MFQSLILLPNTWQLGTCLTLTVHHLLLNYPVHQSSSVERRTGTVTFYAMYWIIMHPLLRWEIYISQLLSMVSVHKRWSFYIKRERRQAGRNWKNTKLTIFKLTICTDRQSKRCRNLHTAKCKFYTERIALASSSKELHQIVNTRSNRHPPEILPAIYPSADLPSIFIKHFNNKVEKLRANIASEHVTSTLVTVTTIATFSSFEKVSQLTVKECILNSAPKSCELDPKHSKL